MFLNSIFKKISSYVLHPFSISLHQKPNVITFIEDNSDINSITNVEYDEKPSLTGMTNLLKHKHVEKEKEEEESINTDTMVVPVQSNFSSRKKRASSHHGDRCGGGGGSIKKISVMVEAKECGRHQQVCSS